MRDILLRADKTKGELLLAFWELYRLRDIPEITVTEVAKKSGYARSTFYSYFADLQDALNAIEQELYYYQSVCIPKVAQFFCADFEPEQAASIYDFLISGSEITYYMTTEEYKKRFLMNFLHNELAEIKKFCQTNKCPPPSDYALAYMLYGSRTVILMNLTKGYPETKLGIVKIIHELNRTILLAASGAQGTKNLHCQREKLGL